MPVYTVSQVAQYVKSTVENTPPLSDLYVTGEVTNVSVSTAGHRYYTLKDVDSQLRCVTFKNAFGGDLLRNGAAVTLHGRVSFYSPRGDLQFLTDFVQSEGVGELHMEFLRVRAKLEAEGLFDPARKRPLPRFPARIAVLTSRSGAVLHDIQTVLGRRFPVVEVLFLHTTVQGDYAVPGIVSGFQTLNLEGSHDLVVLARGGGSLEELAAFNTEEVARAIHGSRAPVISAVGHETDTTIADLVADVRAATPSAAAERAVPDILELRRDLSKYQAAMNRGLVAWVKDRRDASAYAMARLRRLTPDVTTLKLRIDEITRSATAIALRASEIRRESVDARLRQLTALHPTSALNRGYALVRKTRGGTPVSRTSEVRPGDGISVQVSDGTFAGQVISGKDVPRSRTGRRRVPEEQPPLFKA